MKLDLNEILSRVGMRFPYSVDEAPIVDEDLECDSPIVGSIIFSNTGSVLLVDGQISTRVVLECSRCLRYYQMDVDSVIEEQFPLETKPIGPRGRHIQVVVEEDENPDAGKLFEGALFNLTEMLRQNIMLSLPTQPLHDPDCKGLCPHCGTDLNDFTCDCDLTPVNPSLSKLGELLANKRVRIEPS